MDARAILADDHRVWAPKSHHSLWTLIRIAVLHEIWHCRSSRADISGSLGAAVVSRVVRHLQTAIERDWARVAADVRQMSELPEDYFRGRNPELDEEDFVLLWAHRGVLCSVTGGTMALHLSERHPVPVPSA